MLFMNTVSPILTSAFDLTTVTLISSLIVLSVLSLCFIFHLRLKSKSLTYLQGFNSLWTVRFLLVLFIFFWCIIELFRLPFFRRKYLYPLSPSLGITQQANLCKIHIVFSLGFFEPAFLLTLLFLLNASIRKKTPNDGWAVTFVFSTCLPLGILQGLLVYFNPLEHRVPALLRQTFVILEDDTVLCAYPFLNSVVFAAFAAAYCAWLLFSCWKVLSLVINKGLRIRIYALGPNTVPPSSSSQGAVHERNYVFPGHLTPETLTRQAEKHISRQSEGENLNASLSQLEQRKKVDEDDFRVPVYIRSKIGQSNDKSHESFDGKKLTSAGSRNFGFFKAGRINRERDLNNLRSDVRNEIDGPPQVSPNKEQPFTSARDTSNGESIDTSVRQAKVIQNQQFQDRAVFKLSSSRQGDGCLRQDCRAESQSNGTGQRDASIESTRETGKSNDPIANQTSPSEAIGGTEYHDTGTGSPIHSGNLNKNDNISKISRVEDLSTLKISPDDVVAIIGQKQFWKARKAIANQQRVFAVQVFELHRLIKVQQLIAGSPDLLFEDGAFLGKSLPDGSTPKKLALEYVVKPRLQNLKRKVDSENVNQNMECSAENAVGKTSISSVKNGSHFSSSTPFAGNPHHGNMAAENGMGPWCFNQSPGHQWLIPVMSPSEGLVYKPYPGPGFTGTNYGGCGPFGAPPSGGTFMNPSYGMPPPPETPPGSHAYFPPYGSMPFMKAAASESAVEHVNQFSARVQSRHLSEGEGDCNKHNQSSCNLPVQRNGATTHVMHRQRTKEFELQMSTASSPSEMTQGMSTGQVAEGRDALPLFPMVPVEPEGVAQSIETGQQTRVIKVVPHNRRSATESAARIFQSIQEERKQYDTL